MAKTKNKRTNPYPIKLSDWIVFLQNESNLNTNIVTFASTIVIICMIGLLQLPDKTQSTVVAVLLLLGFLFIVLHLLKKRSKGVGELLDDIIEGEITDPKVVRDKWINELKIKQRKR